MTRKVKVSFRIPEKILQDVDYAIQKHNFKGRSDLFNYAILDTLRRLK